MKKKQKTLIFLGSAIVFALISIGSYLGLFFAIKNKTLATKPLLEKVEELSGREERITSSLVILKEEDLKIKKLSSYFFEENEVVDFAKKIEDLGAFSGTDLTLESLDQGIGDEDIPYLDFRITAKGSFEDIYRLLLLLQAFPGKLEWKTVNLRQSGEGISSVWTANISLSALNFINQSL